MASFDDSAASAVGFFGEILLALLELGDIGIDRDGAAVLGAALADHHPAAVVAALHLRLAGIAMLRQPLRDPFLDAAFRILDIAALGGAADDALERRAGAQIDVEARVEQVAIARIADDQPVLAVVTDKAFGNALDRLGEPPLAAQSGLLGAAQRRDVVEPIKPLAAADRDVAAVVGDLDVGDQEIEQFALLGLPDDFLVQQLSAARPQQLDHARAMIEVVPETPGVEQFQLLFFIAGQFAQAPIVEQEPPILVDDIHGGGAEVEDFAKLALLLGDLLLVLRQRGDVVDPQHALAADKTDMAAVITDLHIGQKQMNQRAFLGTPNHLFIEKLAALLAQLVDDPRALIEVMPMHAGIAKVELGFAVAENFAQPRVVEQKPPILVDDQQRRGTELQKLEELALMLGRLGSKSRAAAGRRRSAYRGVR